MTLRIIRPRWVVVILGVVIVFGGLAWGTYALLELQGRQDTLEGLGFNLKNLRDYSVTDTFGSRVRSDAELNVRARNGEEVLRIKILSNQEREAAERYRTGQSILLEAQYDSRLPPYPEFLTNQTGCAERFLPEKVSVSDGVYYLVHADSRFNYGLCSDEMIRYEAGFGVFFCPAQRQVFQVEYFTDVSNSFEEVRSTMDSFRCAS